jgi:hypothetical protein
VTRPGGDDVVIRVGSQRGARTGFQQLQNDLQAAGGDITELRDDLQRLAATTADPEVAIRAQDALADLDRVETYLGQFDGMTAEAALLVDGGAASGDIQAALADLRRVDGETAEMRITVDADSAASEVSGLRSSLSGAATSLGQGIGQSIGSALMDAVGGAVAQSLENEVSNANLAARLVGDPAAMEEAGKVAGRLYAGGYGDSLDTVNQAVYAVISSSAEMRDASEGDIQKVTGLAMDLAKTWDVDVTEAMRATSQLVRTGLVPDTTAGLGLINDAFGRIGPQADDAMDTITEYSTQFRQLGLTGPQAMDMTIQALQAGARDTDVAADALKEYTLKAQEMGDETAEAYTKLGMSATKVQGDIAAGGPAATATLDETLERLRGVQDPAERGALAVAVFGTKFEDMQSALLAMDVTPMTNQFDEYGRKLEEVAQIQGATTQTHIDQVTRGSTAVLSSIWGATEGTEAAVGVAAGAMGLWNDMFGQTAGAAANTGFVVTEESKRAGQALIDGFGRGVGGAWDSVKTLPGKVGGSLAGVFGQGNKAGADLGNGFQAGINSRIQAVMERARALVIQAMNAARSAMGARSPSRKTMEDGGHFGDGYIIGIDSKVAGAEASARNLARSAMAQLRTGDGGQVAGGAAGAAAPAGRTGGGTEVVFSGGLDSAFATAFMGMVRAGKIQIRATT